MNFNCEVIAPGKPCQDGNFNYSIEKRYSLTTGGSVGEETSEIRTFTREYMNYFLLTAIDIGQKDCPELIIRKG